MVMGFLGIRPRNCWVYISRWTIHRRVISMGITNLGDFNLISDDELDQLISDYINRHGATSGLTYI